MLNGAPTVILDVRPSFEFVEEHIEGSLNLPLEQLDAETLSHHKNSPLVLACTSGAKAYQAADLLKQAGFADVSVIAGGLLAWRVMGFPLAGKKHKKHRQ